jgi:Right handed beta helix region
MKRRGAMLLFAVAAAIALCLPPAGATGHHDRGGHDGRGGRHGRLLVVDNSGHRKSCLGTRHPFLAIQAAVDAARPRDTIRVCPGLYRENVVVQTPRLTIEGANAGRDPTARRRRHESIVTGVFADHPKGTVELAADHVTWDGFTIRGILEQENAPGMYTDPAHSGYLVRDTIFQDNGVGLRLGSSGRHPTLVCRNRFRANNEFEPGGGYGVFSDQGARKVAITYNRFEDHNGAGVFFADRGAPQRDVLIDHNKSVDDKSFATIYATARARITHNSVRARVTPQDLATPASAIFLGAGNDQVLVHRNRVHSASGNGIDVSPSPEPNRGLQPRAPTKVTVSKNKAGHAGLAGLHMAAGTAGVAVTANTALDNTEWDCQDESTGVKNTWTGNLGRTSSPAGLCAPPPTTDTPDDGKGHHKKKKKKKDPCACERHPRAY